ncbi:hypothetical protein ACFWPQ_19185 [Streptomyces sp. NPDC058464]|uniref:hypothetical protein n=1 Tax=Streptomyces sp. NPDC058464 TaxID=3346511 RepID=UPI0036663B8F
MGGAPGRVGGRDQTVDVGIGVNIGVNIDIDIDIKDNRRGPAGNRFGAQVGEGVSAAEASAA